MFKNLFGKESKEPKMIITEDYQKWRNVIFSMKAENVGLSSTEEKKLYGMVMDITMIDQKANAIFALSTTAFASGEASFRPTPGGGFIGLGSDPNIAEVAKSTISKGQIFLVKAKPASDFPLPAVGYVTFYFLTTSGLFYLNDTLVNFQSPPYGQLLNKFGQIRGVAEKMIDEQQKK